MLRCRILGFEARHLSVSSTGEVSGDELMADVESNRETTDWKSHRPRNSFRRQSDFSLTGDNFINTSALFWCSEECSPIRTGRKTRTPVELPRLVLPSGASNSRRSPCDV